MGPRDEIVLPHVGPREDVPLASSVRGTVLLSSIRGLRHHGVFERYLLLLDPAHRDTIASLTAPTWFPIEVAIAHYQACDRLELDRATIDHIAGEAGRLINQTVLAVVAKLSKTSGMTPWFALANGNKLIARTWIGSSLEVRKVGPKDARLEWIQHPCARIGYYRAAFGSFAAAICGHLAQTMYVRELPARTETEFSYRMSWV